MSAKLPTGLLGIGDAATLALTNAGRKKRRPSQAKQQILSELMSSTGRRAGQPVRRHSYLKGREGQFWKALPRKDARQIVFAAKRYELETRQEGKRIGALGSIAIEILDYLTNLMDYTTGRLEPSLHHLMEKLKRSKDAIVRALQALRQHGFLDWMRRYVPANDETGRIKVQQTSNAYRLTMPQRALKLLGKYGKAAPIPLDDQHRRDEIERVLADHRASLSCAELPLFDMGTDDKLAQTLARLGAAIDKKNRESAKRSESLSKDYYYRGDPSDTS